MRLGIMQPYLFPYIGYFQLIGSVDKFIVYDDVSYIKQGWINRNRILLNSADHLFTVQLKDASSYRLIKDIQVHERLHTDWKRKFYKTLENAYRKAPYYEPVMNLIKATLESGETSISKISTESLKVVCEYLQIKTCFGESSTVYQNNHLLNAERVIDICQKENATSYTNAIGGIDLYRQEDFAAKGIRLNFLKPRPISYKQFSSEFVPGLSIIDVMMFNSQTSITSYLKEFDLVDA
jgi:hypothetical protein